jgi:hypothetical protein
MPVRPAVVVAPVVIAPVVIPQPPINEMMGKIAVKKQKKRSIGIRKSDDEEENNSFFSSLVDEIAPNGKYISLVNSSSSKDIDLARWQIKQHVDSTPKIRYTIPEGVRLVRGGELRIYAQSGSNSISESASYQKLMNNEIISWGMSIIDA